MQYLLTLYADDLDDQGQEDDIQVEGVVLFSTEEHCWVAAIDWKAIRHTSDSSTSATNGEHLISRSTSQRSEQRKDIACASAFTAGGKRGRGSNLRATPHPFFTWPFVAHA